MMRPSSLYRSDSRREPPIEANANNIHEDSIDCGISILKCCNTPGCQKLGNKRTFMIVLVFCALIQGAIESYFRISAKQAALTHDFDPRIIDWLLVTSGILQGFFAILVAYWGNRMHRTAWLGGLFMLQSIFCLIVIIPTLAQNSDENSVDAIESSILCIRSVNLRMAEGTHGIATLILFFVLQLGIALGMIAFYALGFSYLDDNVNEHESPALIAGALAAKFWGFQLGSLLAIFVEFTSLGWFLGWILLSPILFIIGFLALMFPRRLLSTVVKQAANFILESATNSSHASLANTKFIADISFFPTLYRLITNKILLLNIFAAVFIQTAFINFSRHEANYLQSRFFLPTSEADGLNNEWTSTLITALLKPPMIALSILVAGLIIAKANPKPRKLVIWNIIAASFVVVFYIVSIFIDCENSHIAGSHRGKIIKPFCASSCYCSENVPFMPVCPENGVQTYYSPCHAGCGAEIYINSVRMFGNCSCGVDTELPMEDLMATIGACGMDDCQPFWISYQVLSVAAAALLGSTLIGKLIITLRAVLPQDKSTAIGFELFFIGLIVYVPGKFGYRFIADHTCQYVAPDGFRCFIHESPTYGNLLNIVTAALILIGLVFEVLLLFNVKDMVLYGDEPDDVYKPIEMETLRNVDENPQSETANLLQQTPAEPRVEPMRNPPNPPQANEPVTYAQIIRVLPTQAQARVPTPDYGERFDFRMQTAQNQMNDDNNSIAVTSGRSSISSGYIDLTQNIARNQNQVPRKVRPTSPETSF